MICPRCKRRLLQVSGRWSPETPNRTFRKYVCNDCMIGYTEIVDTDSHEVVHVDETVLMVEKEKQASLDSW